MRASIVVLALLGTFVPTAASGSTVSIDPDPAACAAPAPNPCLFHEANGEQAGDDEAGARLHVRRVDVAIETPGGPDWNTSVNFTELTLKHPGSRALNDTWMGANDSLPPEIHRFVTLESRPIMLNETYRPWGFILVVRLPRTGVAPPLTTLPVYSHDCGFYLGDFGGWNRTCSDGEVRPFGRGVRTGDSTDEIVDASLRTPMCRRTDYQILPGEMCEVSSIPWPVAQSIQSEWEAATPNAELGFEIREIAGGIAPPLNRTPPAPPPKTHDDRTFIGVPVSHLESVPAALALQDPDAPEPDAALSTPAQSVAPQTSLEEDQLLAVSAPPGAPQGVFPRQLVVAIGAAAMLIWWLLYTRLTPDRALDQPTRRDLFQAIEGAPGIRAGTLAQRFQLNYGTVTSHLRTLARAGLVEGRGEGQRHYFAASTSEPARAAALASTSNAAQRIVAAIRTAGSVELRSLPHVTGLAPSTVSETVGRLASAGIVVKHRKAGRVVVRARVLAA